jgi:hypothetical protein
MLREGVKLLCSSGCGHDTLSGAELLHSNMASALCWQTDRTVPVAYRWGGGVGVVQPPPPRNFDKVPKIKKIILYEMKFVVPNYSCLQNPWLGGHCPQIPILSVLNWICWTPPPNKIPGYATAQCCFDKHHMSMALKEKGERLLLLFENTPACKSW